MIYDFCVVGGGIVGLATAVSLLEARPGASVLILEKEESYGRHQTGHNSGVIHAGIYYKPGSLKAELCRAGSLATKAFCDEHNIPYEVIGKLVVATTEAEQARLAGLYANAVENGIKVETLDANALKEREPNVSGLAALHVPSSGIVDYVAVAKAMAAIVARAGGDTHLGVEVRSIRDNQGLVEIVSDETRWLARRAVVCGGLQADRLARSSGIDVDFQVVPFRGEYYRVRDEKRNIVKHMIYPVPEPDLPFLGIHLTPMIDGSLTVGPNAVLGLSREGYRKFSANFSDMAAYMTFPGFWKMISANLHSGINELRDSLSKGSYLKKCQKYCPDLSIDDLQPYRAGIRAQAVTRSGEMVHDFRFLRAGGILHVCNAPSPAATSAIPIGQMVVKRLLEANA
jgi:L-2-hydroxyglutarate oxidase